MENFTLYNKCPALHPGGSGNMDLKLKACIEDVHVYFHHGNGSHLERQHTYSLVRFALAAVVMVNVNNAHPLGVKLGVKSTSTNLLIYLWSM